jgi:aminoglycoside phosphotransferase (APT) family kinase protein
MLAHYRVVSKLGEGGTGEVYRAHDDRLDRDVAIKVLPEEVAQDEARLARFEREAKLLASLNHQNIATLHGLEEHEGQRFLVMELAEGETLADRIKKGAVPVGDALEIALQIAEGLEAAHEQGIIHRDLKPANVMLSPEGKVKVLDFGLAKAWQPEEENAELTRSPTLTAQMTAAGVLLGTAAYMSPEQARGKPVDKRADIWAFGCVLWEMLTGKRLFKGDTVSDVLAAVLREEPDWRAIPDDTPWGVRNVLRRCLQKEPNRRLHAIADARIDIEDAASEPLPPYPSPPVSRAGTRRGATRFGAAAALVVTGALVGGGLVTALVWYSVRSEQAATSRGSPPVVVLMDTPAPRGVYDPETRNNSGTNADDLNDLLRDLPIVLHKETLGATWNREDQLLKQRPDLIVIHRSAFFHSINLEFDFGYPPFDDPEHQARFDRLYGLVDSKLVSFLGYVGLGDPRTKFVVYSRGSGGGWDEGQRSAWVADIEDRFPPLKGRVFTMRVPVGPEGASFRDAGTGRLIRQHVVSLLGLAGPDTNQESP